jgi:hypothetical protein
MAIHAAVGLIQEGTLRGGRQLEWSLMDHNSILDFGADVSMISPAAFWQIWTQMRCFGPRELGIIAVQSDA